METARAALRSLTQGDTTIIEGVAYERDPLIVLLRQAVTASIGGSGSSGAGGDRSLLNTAALDLYDHIDGWVRACLQEWNRPHTGELVDVLERLFHAVQAEQAVWLSPDDAERIYARFPEWVQKIEDLFDPPHVKEFPGACPGREGVPCGATHHVVDGVQNLALAAVVRPGRALVVECRVCGRMWVGRDELTGLAEHIGATVDWVALWEVSSGSCS